ncbi:hypothetical protein [Mycolicibacterium mengxianglii]|uniref:hypothetical protein n=1 Tax=Mycolicibacterium mengxianglii TaxID=2736649 RepID=UPI0018EECFEC|nr:hypothetical protein [Mycolicibacterium mengxianglii]
MLNTLHAAPAPSWGDPHTLVFFVAAFAFLTLTFVPQGNARSVSWQRKVYWSGTFGGAACAFVASLPNVATGSFLAGLAVFVMCLPAYFTTQYIKIGGRVIAFESATDLRASRSEAGDGLREDQPYGSNVTAAKLWWLLVVCAVMGAGNVYAYLFGGDELIYGVAGSGILVAVGALFGCGDGLRLQRIARGQYVPFAVTALISAGIMTVPYLAARSIALRWKLSRH